MKDSGIGIPQAEQERIFSKMFRASNTEKTHAEGTGLGLYTIQTTLKTAGGNIKFSSKEGRGSTFYVHLPLKGMKAKKGSRALE